MSNLRRAVVALFAAACAGGLPLPAAAAEEGKEASESFREIDWLALVPKDWKPQERLDRKKAQSLNDGDELAQEMMRELREILDSAPTVGAMDGQGVKLPGYVVPLEQTKDGLTEFLLVPYFGACIHTPPPPANQIVHVVSRRPVKGFQSMSAVWVRGTLRTVRKDSGMEAYRPQ